MMRPSSSTQRAKAKDGAAEEKMVSVFNGQVGDFARKLIRTFPGSEVQLRTHYNTMLVAMRVSPSSLVEGFYDHVHEYFEKIRKRDEDFFLSKAAEKMPIFDGIDMVANWNASPPSVRKAIWSYMTTLVDLSEAHHKLKTAPQEAAKAADTFDAEVADVQARVGDMAQQLERKAQRLGLDPRKGDDLTPAVLEVSKDLNVDLSVLQSIDPSVFQQSLSGLPGVSAEDRAKMVAFMTEQLGKLSKAAGAQRARAEPAPSESASGFGSAAPPSSSVGGGDDAYAAEVKQKEADIAEAERRIQAKREQREKAERAEALRREQIRKDEVERVRREEERSAREGRLLEAAKSKAIEEAQNTADAEEAEEDRFSGMSTLSPEELASAVKGVVSRSTAASVARAVAEAPKRGPVTEEQARLRVEEDVAREARRIANDRRIAAARERAMAKAKANAAARAREEQLALVSAREEAVKALEVDNQRRAQLRRAPPPVEKPAQPTPVRIQVQADAFDDDSKDAAGGAAGMFAGMDANAFLRIAQMLSGKTDDASLPPNDGEDEEDAQQPAHEETRSFDFEEDCEDDEALEARLLREAEEILRAEEGGRFDAGLALISHVTSQSGPVAE